jgi:hypothetical protein
MGQSPELLLNYWIVAGIPLGHSLVGGLEHGFYDFPYIGRFIIPTDFHIFQRARYTTNQVTILTYIEPFVSCKGK